MRNKLLLVIILLVLSCPVWGADPEEAARPPETFPLTLTLTQALHLALENNLNLRAVELDTRASHALVRKGYGLYDPRLRLALAFGDRQQQLNEQFFSAETREKYRLFDFALEQKLPTGADLALIFDNFRSDEEPAPGINPSYGSEARLSLVQPLLRGFGTTVTEQTILFAAKDREVAVNDLRQQAAGLLAEVRDSYFEGLRLRKNLAFRETSVALADRILAETKARVKAGSLPPVDILEAEVGLKQRERERLDAERALLDSLDNLAVLIGLQTPIRLAQETLEQPEVPVDPDLAFSAAVVKRPDLQRRLREIERLELENRLRRNDLLPALDLTGSYGHSGLGDTYGNDLRDIGGGDFPSWEVGLSLSYPLGNREARYEYRRTRLLLQGQRARIQQFKREIRQEILAAIRLLEVSRKVIDVTATGLDFAEEKLRILLKRREVGLATTRDVFEGEDDLAEAQTAWITALADYNKAITRYYQVTGLLLEETGVSFAGDFDDESRSLLQLEEL